ncbi:ATP-dependent DNA helicase MER3 [Penicillium diatomitis]|uniref:DNA 3'-5' helicase n=1 Tax=Penicillium diatomitis TaxID=2819901 RepID=A0A9W9X325_9EURO|nr:ATP-dependent DNA helicase MER3 [Penicillium diatomitis]KAJ5482973.1 ATP-dependent DNA helicase MER3 [Penicillium diatomitis]
MVFCCTRNSAVTTAKELVKVWNSTNPPARLWKGPGKRLSISNDDLKATTAAGVAFHHAGLSAADRLAVEKGFLDGQVNVICCTSTLAVGVNLPCQLVIIKNTVCWQDGGWKQYSDLEMMQMLGRAGRPQFDDTATAVILTRKDRVAHYERLISGSESLESCLHLNLIEHLNAEIGLGIVSDILTAIKWLSSTFLFVRLRRNPGHYKLQNGNSQDDKEALLKQICEKDLELLRQSGLVDTKKTCTTAYGDAMARYYVRFETMKKIVSLKTKSDIHDIYLRIFTARIEPEVPAEFVLSEDEDVDVIDPSLEDSFVTSNSGASHLMTPGPEAPNLMASNTQTSNTEAFIHGSLSCDAPLRAAWVGSPFTALNTEASRVEDPGFAYQNTESSSIEGSTGDSPTPPLRSGSPVPSLASIFWGPYPEDALGSQASRTSSMSGFQWAVLSNGAVQGVDYPPVVPIAEPFSNPFSEPARWNSSTHGNRLPRSNRAVTFDLSPATGTQRTSPAASIQHRMPSPHLQAASSVQEATPIGQQVASLEEQAAPLEQPAAPLEQPAATSEQQADPSARAAPDSAAQQTADGKSVVIEHNPQVARTLLPNGRLSCVHVCRANSECTHRCCKEGAKQWWRSKRSRPRKESKIAGKTNPGQEDSQNDSSQAASAQLPEESTLDASVAQRAVETAARYASAGGQMTSVPSVPLASSQRATNRFSSEQGRMTLLPSEPASCPERAGSSPPRAATREEEETEITEMQEIISEYLLSPCEREETATFLESSEDELTDTAMDLSG